MASNSQTPPSKVYLFGQEYHPEVTFTHQLPIGIHIHQSKLLINAISPDHHWHTPATQKQLMRFLKSTAQAYIHPRTHHFAKKMKTSFGDIRYKKQKTRWGSCSSQGNLNFNWQLIHFPTNIIDAVIIHELAHRTHLDHSSKFWNLVGQYDPEYAKHRGWLKRQAKHYLIY